MNYIVWKNNKWKIGKKIGSGTQAKVWIFKYGNETKAIKQSRRSKKYNDIHPVVLREISLLKYLSHPNIITVDDVIIDNTFVSMIMPFYPSNLHETMDITYENKINIIKQLLEGLGYLHSVGIAHRDIKPENILYNPDDNKVVLADFGLARSLVGHPPMSPEVVTVYYRAPEILIDGHYTIAESIDVWSLACVIFELLVGEPLFQMEDELSLTFGILSVVGTPLRWREKMPDFPSRLIDILKGKGLEEKWVQLLKPMLEPIPEARPSIFRSYQQLFREKHPVKKNYKLKISLPINEREDEEIFRSWITKLDLIDLTLQRAASFWGKSKKHDVFQDKELLRVACLWLAAKLEELYWPTPRECLKLLDRKLNKLTTNSLIKELIKLESSLITYLKYDTYQLKV